MLLTQGRGMPVKLYQTEKTHTLNLLLKSSAGIFNSLISLLVWFFPLKLDCSFAGYSGRVHWVMKQATAARGTVPSMRLFSFFFNVFLTLAAMGQCCWNLPKQIIRTLSYSDFPRFPTAWGSFTCAARRTWVRHVLLPHPMDHILGPVYPLD